MVLQAVRGFVWFSDKNLAEIEKAFKQKPVELKSCRLGIFNGIMRFGKSYPSPGVFISGTIDRKYSSEDVVGLLKKYAGSNIALGDMTVEKESAYLKRIKNGNILKGNYIGLRILSPYKTPALNIVAERRLLGYINASEIYMRTVESEFQKDPSGSNTKKPLICLEVITTSKTADIIPFIEGELVGNRIAKEKYTEFTII